MNNPEETIPSQDEDSPQEEQPKLRILKDKKKKKPVSQKRRQQLARARATKAKKAMQKRLLEEQQEQMSQEEQMKESQRVTEERLRSLIKNEVEDAMQQFLSGDGSDEEPTDTVSAPTATPSTVKSAPPTTVVDYSYLFQQ